MHIHSNSVLHYLYNMAVDLVIYSKSIQGQGQKLKAKAKANVRDSEDCYILLMLLFYFFSFFTGYSWD